MQVFDKDKVGKDKWLGMVTLDTAQWEKERGIPAEWYPLEGVSSGTSHLTKISWIWIESSYRDATKDKFSQK